MIRKCSFISNGGKNNNNFLPNIITLVRLVGAALLLLTTPLSTQFFMLYIACGTSDVLDGYLARKTNCTSKLGATLDSIADLVLIAVLFIQFLPILPITFWMFCWLGGITFIRLTSLLIGFWKYHAVAFLHTYANKATGLALFCFPLLYDWLGLAITASFLCSIATLSALEELLINLTSKTLLLNRKSFFTK
jgi:CDP-diacylglycerol--glycerol-3-phosphate 3-phosphatidyltransferase